MKLVNNEFFNLVTWPFPKNVFWPINFALILPNLLRPKVNFMAWILKFLLRCCKHCKKKSHVTTSWRPLVIPSAKDYIWCKFPTDNMSWYLPIVCIKEWLRAAHAQMFLILNEGCENVSTEHLIWVSKLT